MFRIVIIKIISSFLHNLALLLASTSKFLTKAQRAINLAAGLFGFSAQDSDIFVVTYPRSGTTLVQMVMYQLTTDGDVTKIRHISDQIPFLERQLALGRNFKIGVKRRIFKTHLSYKLIPKSRGKYIYIARDEADVVISYYNFYKSHLAFSGSFDAFFEIFMKGKVQYGTWIEHVSAWNSANVNLDVLHIRYEDLASNLPAAIAKIATFCGIETPPNQLVEIAKRCSIDYMKSHEDKFDHALEVNFEKKLTSGNFIRNGQAGSGLRHLSAEQIARLHPFPLLSRQLNPNA